MVDDSHGGLYGSKEDYADRHPLDAIAINARLELQKKGITDIKAVLQQVMETVSMFQQGCVRQLARSLLVHRKSGQVDSKVRRQAWVSIHNHKYTLILTLLRLLPIRLRLLSPSPTYPPISASTYDQIRLRLQYRRILASTSDTIELSTENGTIILCRKQASGMEAFLDRAESLPRDIVQSRSIIPYYFDYCGSTLPS